MLHPFSTLRLHIPYGWYNSRILSEVNSHKLNLPIILSLSDITINTSESLIFTLRKSKPDQLGVSFPINIFHLNSYVSPYKPLTKYINISTRYAAKASPQHQLFLTEQQGKCPLSSGSRSIYAKSLAFQAYVHNTIRATMLPYAYNEIPQLFLTFLSNKTVKIYRRKPILLSTM